VLNNIFLEFVELLVALLDFTKQFNDVTSLITFHITSV